MKKIILKIFRDIPSSCLLIVGFCLTIFIAMVCCGFVNNLVNSKHNFEDERINHYYLNLYHTNRRVQIYDNGILSQVEEGAERINFDTIYEVMEKNQINFYGKWFVFIGEGQEQQRLATVIYSFDETIPFLLESGYVDWSEDDYTVIIGESMKAFITRLDNEDYLYVNGEYYKVTGMAKNNGLGGYDSSLYFICQDRNSSAARTVEKEIIDEIMFGETCEITSYSIDSEIVNNIKTAKSELENNHPLHVDIESEPSNGMTENKAMNFLYASLNMVFMPVLLFFSIGSCYSITSLWVKVRKTDIAIRITYGFGQFQVYKWIMKEISLLLLISLVISLSMRILYLAAFGELYTLTANIVYDTLIIGGAMVITLLITSLGAYKHSKAIIPAAVLKEL